MTNQETKMLLFYHHTKSHQGYTDASVGMWWVLGDCLIIDILFGLYGGSGEMVFLTCFGSVSHRFIHFNAVLWLYGNVVINLQSEPLDWFLY